MNWDYVTGLFDGEGSCGIARIRGCFNNTTGRKRYPSVLLIIVFTSSDKKALLSMKSFLRTKGVISYLCAASSIKRPIYRLQIQSGKGLKKFVEMVYPRSKMKRRQLSVMKKAILLREALKYERMVYKSWSRFDVLRCELHSYSMKGPRTLKVLE